VSRVADRDPRLASERLVDLAPEPTGNSRADWKLRLETTLILETSVSTYNHNQQEGYWPTVTLIFLLEPTANG